MFDEESAKKDLDKMKKIYEKAIKDLDDIKVRQDKIAEIIYKAPKKSDSNN